MSRHAHNQLDSCYTFCLVVCGEADCRCVSPPMEARQTTSLATRMLHIHYVTEQRSQWCLFLKRQRPHTAQHSNAASPADPIPSAARWYAAAYLTWPLQAQMETSAVLGLRGLQAQAQACCTHCSAPVQACAPWWYVWSTALLNPAGENGRLHHSYLC